MVQAGSLMLNTGSSQASAQASQNVHSPFANDTTGVLAGPLTKMASGQAAMQSPHPKHAFLIDISVVQGGRICAPGLPAKSARLDNACDPDLPTIISL